MLTPTVWIDVQRQAKGHGVTESNSHVTGKTSKSGSKLYLLRYYSALWAFFSLLSLKILRGRNSIINNNELRTISDTSIEKLPIIICSCLNPLCIDTHLNNRI